MTVYRSITLGALVVLVASVGLGLTNPASAADNKLPDEVQAILGKAEQFELLSLDPARPKDKPKDEFHGWKVLGTTTVKEGDARKAVLSAMNDGIKGSDGKAAFCFNPRHGIRAKHDGKTVELVICFECLALQVFVDGKFSVNVKTTGSPQDAFDKVLRDAKITLPAKPEK